MQAIGFRVRRPIVGLVRDNYPPGLAATYRFIPKQTTGLLYTALLPNAIVLTPVFELFFDIFSPFPVRNQLILIKFRVFH